MREQNATVGRNAEGSRMEFENGWRNGISVGGNCFERMYSQSTKLKSQINEGKYHLNLFI